MRTRSPSLWPLLPLTLLAALSFWLERSISPETHGNAAARHDPDFWVDNFSVKRFGPDGKPQNTLWGLKMTHFPDDDSTLISNPKLTYYRDQPVELSAAIGLVGKDGKQIALVNNVKIVRQGRDGGAPVIVDTATLTIYPDTEQARAESKVLMRQGKSVISGSAMDIDNRTGVSVLHGPVIGTIQPYKRP